MTRGVRWGKNQPRWPVIPFWCFEDNSSAYIVNQTRSNLPNQVCHLGIENPIKQGTHEIPLGESFFVSTQCYVEDPEIQNDQLKWVSFYIDHPTCRGYIYIYVVFHKPLNWRCFFFPALKKMTVLPARASVRSVEWGDLARSGVSEIDTPSHRGFQWYNARSKLKV